MKHPAVRTPAMLKEVDALPRPERESTLDGLSVSPLRDPRRGVEKFLPLGVDR